MHEKGEYLRGRYLIRGIIGSGGTSTVYLAMDTDIGKNWAIKEIAYNKDYADKLADSEINNLKKLDHPMLPRIVEAWRDSESFFIVSDYIEGISLGSLIESGPLSRNRTYHLLLQVLEVLSYLHELNPPILFLDLKPDNILVRMDGRISLVDFGIAVNSANSSMGFGTPGFAAPEQFKKAELRNISVKTDIYAFGITYFCVRTGCHPEPDADSMAQIIKENTILSSPEKRMVMRCIQINPDNRFTSAKQVIRRLHRVNLRIHKTHLFIPCVLFPALLIMVFLMLGSWKEKADYSRELEELIQTDENGRYTKNDLRIVASYINSGMLEDGEKEYYAFEAARTYFEVYCDYREAEYYFSMLDEKKYPQREYYLKLCRFQRAFDFDRDDIKKCLSDFGNDVMLLPESRMKYENLIFIAFCYGQYLKEEDTAEEILSSITKHLSGLSRDYEWKGEVICEAEQALCSINITGKEKE